MKRLETYDWPGNVRELRNTIERAMILAGSGMIGVEHLPPHFGEPGFAPHRRGWRWCGGGGERGWSVERGAAVSG